MLGLPATSRAASRPCDALVIGPARSRCRRAPSRRIERDPDGRGFRRRRRRIGDPLPRNHNPARGQMGIKRLTGDPRRKETIEHGHDIRTRASHTRSLAPHTDKNLRCGHPVRGSPRMSCIRGTLRRPGPA